MTDDSTFIPTPLRGQEPCVFCQKIADEDFAFMEMWCAVFEPLNPVVDGHLLVVPFEHAASASDDPQAFSRASRVAAIIASRLRTDVNIINNNGPDAGQTVMHTHVHIVPRRPGDGLVMPWDFQKDEGGPHTWWPR